MEITITLQDLLVIIIAIGVIILIGYLIKLIKTLIGTAERANAVLDNAEVISASAIEATKNVEELVDEVSEAGEIITSLIKGNQSGTKAVTNIVNSVAGIKDVLSRKKPSKKDDK